jgi:hypothetical protein
MSTNRIIRLAFKALRRHVTERRVGLVMLVKSLLK